MDRILVVEDDDCMNASLVAALANEYEVRAVTDGDAAVDFLDHNAVDLVLLDMVIPERDGLSVLSHIAGMAPKPQVVVLSVLAQISKVVKTMRLGASGRPSCLSAARTRSRDSWTAAPGRPTTVKFGKPPLTNASTRTRMAWTPRTVAAVTTAYMASTIGPLPHVREVMLGRRRAVLGRRGETVDGFTAAAGPTP